jgi:hypothetical protein
MYQKLKKSPSKVDSFKKVGLTSKNPRIFLVNELRHLKNGKKTPVTTKLSRIGHKNISHFFFA